VNEWLVSGVYDALKRQYVQKIQLSIGAAHDSSTFFEEYAFSVVYHNGAPHIDLELHGNASASLSASGATAAPPVRVALSREEQYNSVTRMLRSMVTLLTPLPDLINDDKRVSVRLQYVPDTPEDYEPPGFRALLATNVDDARLFPQHGVLSDYDVLDFGALHTHYHSLALSFTSLAASELDDEDSSLRAAPARIAPVDADQEQPQEVFDVEDIVDDQDQLVVDENISCEPFASATPLEVDENEDQLEPHIEQQVAVESVVPTPSPPPLRSVLTQMTLEQVQQRRNGSVAPPPPPPLNKLPPLQTALSQLRSPVASPGGVVASISASGGGGKSVANRDREALLQLRDAALQLLSRARVGEAMTTARIQQYVVADGELATMLLRRFEKDGLVKRMNGRGYVVTTKGVGAHERMQQKIINN
jgi:hypothetical protein